MAEVAGRRSVALMPRELSKSGAAPRRAGDEGSARFPVATQPESGSCDAALDNRQISSYSSFVRRKKGVLIPIEAAILRCAVDLQRRGETEFHGFFIAKELRDRDEARRLTAHGTLYKALDRLEKAGLVQSRWEDPDAAASEGRPRRRLYQLTGLGERVGSESRTALPAPRPKPGLEPA